MSWTLTIASRDNRTPSKAEIANLLRLFAESGYATDSATIESVESVVALDAPPIPATPNYTAARSLMFPNGAASICVCGSAMEGAQGIGRMACRKCEPSAFADRCVGCGHVLERGPSGEIVCDWCDRMWGMGKYKKQQPEAAP